MSYDAMNMPVVRHSHVNAVELIDSTVPKRKHNPNKGSAAYHARIQKKWMKRFGMVKVAGPVRVLVLPSHIMDKIKAVRERNQHVRRT